MTHCDWPPHRDEPRCEKWALMNEIESLRFSLEHGPSIDDIASALDVSVPAATWITSALLDAGMAVVSADVADSMVNYRGPDTTVECALAGCTNRLRKSAADVPQYCSKSHRGLSGQTLACPTCADRGVVYSRNGVDNWEPEDCPDCPTPLDNGQQITTAEARENGSSSGDEED